VVVDATSASAEKSNGKSASMYRFLVRTDAPTCAECGSIMVPNGSCHKCINCGTTSGCS
jgi:ribonucleoside-diphosphate reductase alpha chain